MHTIVTGPSPLDESFSQILGCLEESPQHLPLGRLVRSMAEQWHGISSASVHWRCARSRVESVTPKGSTIVNSLQQFRDYCRSLSSGSAGLLLSRLLRSQKSEVARRASFELTAQALKHELRVLTLNMWGISPLSGHFDVDARCQRLFDALIPSLPDIIFLQEVWHPATRDLVHHLPFPSVATDGKLGSLLASSGLAILSRFPIVRQHFYRYRATAGMEHFVRKGALFVEIETPQFGRIELVNTHLISEPERLNRFFVSDQHVHQLRAQQIAELSVFLSSISDGLSPRLIAGDFNLDESYQEYPTLCALAGEDLYRTHLGACPSQERDEDIEGCTFDPTRNRYAVSPSGRPERIDHIWIANSPAHLALRAHRRFVQELVSDHYGVEVSLALSKEIH